MTGQFHPVFMQRAVCIATGRRRAAQHYDYEAQSYRHPQRDAMNTMKKKSTNDLRDDDRTVTYVAIICRPYASSGNVRSAQGVMRNFSRQGAYIEIDRKFNR